MAVGRYRVRNSESGAEYAYVDYGVPSSNGEIPRAQYEAQRYSPSFDALPTKETFVAANTSEHSGLIAHYRNEQEKLRQSIRLMQTKVLGVGDPITIPHEVNERTKRFISDLTAGVEELEEAIKILQGFSS